MKQVAPQQECQQALMISPINYLMIQDSYSKRTLTAIESDTHSRYHINEYHHEVNRDTLDLLKHR